MQFVICFGVETCLNASLACVEYLGSKNIYGCMPVSAKIWYNRLYIIPRRVLLPKLFPDTACNHNDNYCFECLFVIFYETVSYYFENRAGSTKNSALPRGCCTREVTNQLLVLRVLVRLCRYVRPTSVYITQKITRMYLIKLA